MLSNPFADGAVLGLAVTVSATAAAVALLGPVSVPWACAGALAGYLLASAVAAAGIAQAHAPVRLGGANVVTQLRMALCAGLAVPLFAGMPGGWSVAALAALAVTLDGLDGWVARRTGRASVFGARFDMEVDSMLALLLGWHAFLGGLGPAALVLGGARPVFVGALLVWPWLGADLPPGRMRKAVCVLQMAVLVGVQVPALPAPWAGGMVLVAAAALGGSFGRDIAWLAARRPG